MKPPRAVPERPALDLIEDAMALLRRCPAGIALLYYAGSVPFILGLLYFWADMSRGAFAAERVVDFSLWLGIAFVWCKCLQSISAAHLMALAGRQPPPRWTLRKLWRVAAIQITIQPTGLFVVPIAAVIMIPFGTAYAYYQNAMILALDRSGEPPEGRALHREALAQARRWPMQNHLGIGILSLFGLVVFLNVLVIILALPVLLKALFGLESMFSRGLFSMFNTTVFAAAGGVTYLCVDPIFKAFYVLRCFRGRSISTGDDLRVTLRVSTAARQLAAVASLLLLCCAGGGAHAAALAGVESGRPAQIDQSISAVLARPEFAWRAPRVAGAASPQAPGFMEGVVKVVRKWLRPVKRAAGRFFRWLGRWMFRRSMESAPAQEGGGAGWLPALKFFAWIFCGMALAALAIMAWRMWQGREATPELLPQPLKLVPDLEAESLTADQLPEDAWMELAQDLIRRGEFRLALRASYLAALAHLGQREIISIARYKSNREYQRELLRRRPAHSDLAAAFALTVAAFERAWYGTHEVTLDILEISRLNLEKIRQC